MNTVSISVFVDLQLISQEANEGVEYEYYLPNGRLTEGYYWSYGSWSACSKECGSGQCQTSLSVFHFMQDTTDHKNITFLGTGLIKDITMF